MSIPGKGHEDIGAEQQDHSFPHGGHHRLGILLWCWRHAAAPSRFQASVVYFVARKCCARRHSSGEMGMSINSTPNVVRKPWRKAACNAANDTGCSATSFTAPIVL